MWKRKRDNAIFLGITLEINNHEVRSITKAHQEGKRSGMTKYRKCTWLYGIWLRAKM